MEKHKKIYKKAGETPLERLERLREEEPLYADKKLSYAGRLDPMAEGIMLVLIGEENKERQKHLKYAKEYTFEILFGFSTDTYDLLGMVKKTSKKHPNKKELKEILSSFKGEIEQEYPPFSSKPVKGKPLFLWAKEEKLGKIKIPSHIVIIHSLKLISEKKTSKAKLRRIILEKIKEVKGDFRQKEILEKWSKILNKIPTEEFSVFKLKAKVSSGTYVRALANDIGKTLNIPALAFSIKRDEIEIS